MMWTFTGDGDYTGQADTVNNIEKVTLDVTSANVGQGITVSVVSNGLASADAQKFAVVVSGNLAGGENAPTPPTTEMPTNLTLVNESMVYNLDDMQYFVSVTTNLSPRHWIRDWACN